MCYYCDDNVKFGAEDEQNAKSAVRVENYYLVVDTDNAQDFFEINFCPMCGQEL